MGHMQNEYLQIFQALEKNDIRYLIVGGLAVNLHGPRRYTADIDILLALEAENLEKMTKVMHSLGYIERLPVDLATLSDVAQVKKWLKEKGMTAFTFLSNRGQRVDIDILAGHSLKFDEFDTRRVLIDAGGLMVPVISLDDLIELKKEANRGKDILDIEALLALKGI